MSRLASLFILFLCSSTVLLAQNPHGFIYEGLSIESDILGKDVRFTIYLPADYETSQRYYPIVYLLHGYTDDDTGWLQFGEVDRIADKAIAEGSIPPMIIAMPDGGVSWYINDYTGGVRWEDMFIDEFMPYIESTYRVRTQKEFRGIAGLSMGGYGSLVLSMRRPDLFAATAAFSSGVWTDEQMDTMEHESYETIYGILYGENLRGIARLTNHWRTYSVLDIVKNTPADVLNLVRYYIN